MAAPTFTPTFNADTNMLTLAASENVTQHTGYDAGAITVTDAAGRQFTNAAGDTAATITGLGTDEIVLAMTFLTSDGTTPSSYSIAADAFKNGANEGNAEVLDEPMYVHLKEVAEGLTRDDYQAFLETFALITDGTLDATASPQTANLTTIIATTLAAFSRAPKTEDRAYALVDAHNKFTQSSKSPQDHAALAFAVSELQNSLNPRGAMLMKSNGE